MSGQHCKSTLAQHSIYCLKQYFTNVDGWARRSSFVKYIGNFTYNDLNVMPGQHCRSTLAQHYVFCLKQYYTNVDGWTRKSSFAKYIGNFSYNVSNGVTVQHCSTTLAQLYVDRFNQYYALCWLLSAPIIIRQIYRKLFLQWFKCCTRSALQHTTSTTLRWPF